MSRMEWTPHFRRDLEGLAWRAEKDREAYRVIRLVEGGQVPRFPPGQVQYLEGSAFAPDVSAEWPPPARVVLGEKGAGLTFFTEWLRRAIPGTACFAEVCVNRAFAESGAVVERTLVEAFVEDVGTAWARLEGDDLVAGDDDARWWRDLPSGFVRALAEYDRRFGARHPLLVVIGHWTGVRPADVRRLLQGLRGLLEEPRPLRHVAVILAGEDESVFATEGIQGSRFDEVADFLRLPFLDAREIELLAGARFGLKVKAADRLGAIGLEWTGGQPRLVDLFLRNVAEENLTPEQAGEMLLRRPPRTSLKRWQLRLAEITQGNSRLRRFVEACARSERFLDSVVDDEWTSLFTAGWVRQDIYSGCWTIRSRAHREWAMEPLNEPGRFIGGGTDDE